MRIYRLLLSAASLCFAINALGQNMLTVGAGKEDSPQPFKVQGLVTSLVTEEVMPGTNVQIPRQKIGTSTNEKGQFEFRLYKGLYEVKISRVGYETTTRKVDVRGPGLLRLSLEESVTTLAEIIVETEGYDQNITQKEIGKAVLSIESIKELPAVAGEVDVLKSLTLLPGVSTQGETSSGFNVRGGGIDQNLILLGGATLYNPSHLFGFFTGFNASVVRDVAFYKGAIPANFAGRGSSVVDVSYKKGNFGQWTGEASLGVAASRFSAGGPVIKDKVAILAAGRIAYPNWMLRRTKDPNIVNSTAGFYDGNVILNYLINEKNDLEYSFYISDDRFQFANYIANEWRNLAQVVRWNSTISPSWTFQFAAVQNRYQSLWIDDTPFNSFELEAGIKHDELNAGVTWEPSSKQKLQVGLQTKFLENNLGDRTPTGNSAIDAERIDPENALESGIYFQHELDVTEKIGIAYGLRYSDFRNRGPGTINVYDPTLPRLDRNAIGSQEFGNEAIATFGGFEPRASVNFRVDESSSIKAGYSRIFQYIHLITNTAAAAPTDTWKLSDPFLEPQLVEQYSLGYFRNFKQNQYEFSVEAYYKDLGNLVEYKDGADLFLNPTLETDLITGSGQTYGLEVYAKKGQGRWSGWVSYTFSRSFRTVEGEFEDETINGGERFAANFDAPHNLSTVVNYKFSAYATLSGIFNFSSGRPYSLPLGRFTADGVDLPFFAGRNNARGPTHHRLDLSFTFRFPSRQKIFDGDWTLAVYNFYGRKNPFSVFFQDIEGAPPQAYKLSVVGSPFPSLSYEIKF